MQQCAQKARAEKPDHASAMEMGSRMIAPFGHDKRNWGWVLRLDTMGVVEGKPFHRSHFGQATKNGALSLAKETGRRSLGCIRTIWAKSSNANLEPLV